MSRRRWSTSSSGASTRWSASSMSAVVTSRRNLADLALSVMRLRAIVMNHAAMSRPCQEKESILRRARRKVSDVRSSASLGAPDPDVDVAVDDVDVPLVQQAERLRVAALGELDERGDALEVLGCRAGSEPAPGGARAPGAAAVGHAQQEPQRAEHLLGRGPEAATVSAP